MSISFTCKKGDLRENENLVIIFFLLIYYSIRDD